MNKEQKTITALELCDFSKRLDDAFRDGWRVIPGTIIIALCTEGQHHNSKERYIAVVEK